MDIAGRVEILAAGRSRRPQSGYRRTRLPRRHPPSRQLGGIKGKFSSVHRRFIGVRYTTSIIALDREVRSLTFASGILHYLSSTSEGSYVELGNSSGNDRGDNDTNHGGKLATECSCNRNTTRHCRPRSCSNFCLPAATHMDSRRTKNDPISVIVVVILVVIIGLIYLVPGLASVLASVGPTTAALVTAVLALFGVLIAQIVTLLVFLIERIERWLEHRPKQERAEEEQTEEQARETVRADEEQPRETLRAQENTLDSSLDRITDLLSSLEAVDRRAAARAWAQTALSRLDRDHKKILLQFLHAANLIKKEVADRHEQPVITLRGADLSGANLDDADLSGDSLNGANLSGASLRNTDLRGTDLYQVAGWH